MPLTTAPTLQTLYRLLGEFIVGIVPANVKVIQGIPNRVSMPPPVPGFVVMTAILLNPHRTPQESWDQDNPDPQAIAFEQGTLVTVQLDCYGADSAEWAVMLMTTLRTDYACVALAPVSPLFADNPIRAPLVNSEAQYEDRWIVGAHLQYNPVVSTPMQFADSAEIEVINVDERFPP